MFRILLITTQIFVGSLFCAQIAVGGEEKKVDLESLGLDDVDKKPEAVEVKNEEPVAAQPSQAAEKIEGIFSKIQNLVSEKVLPLVKPEQEVQKEVVEKKEVKKPQKKYLNAAKKRALKKQESLAKRREENERRQEEKLKKLNELREQYLKKAEKYSDDHQNLSDEDFEKSDEIITPQKKNLNPFISDEVPPVPLLSQYRTSDNLHIPLTVTSQEKIDVLFNSIAEGIIAYFNAAYKNVENPNIKNSAGDSALTYAILLRRYPIIAAIISKGADLEMPNALGYNPTTIAIEMKDFKTFELLVNNKINLNYTDIFGQTYLMYATRAGFLSAVDLLLSRGVDINAMDKDGNTALGIAYRYKREVIVKFLLKNGAQAWVEKKFEPKEQSIIKELENRWK